MKLCMGCMEQMEDHLTVCPHCGFDESTLVQESYYLKPGTIIGGKYIVGRVVNYSGHTISYLGMDAEANQKVVVKEYLPSEFSTRSEGETEVTIYSGDAKEQFEQGLTNFLNEANRIQHLQDITGIAKVYDCIAENDTGYVISEYIEGHTLKEILASGKKYSVEKTVEFITKILTGLSQVHPLNVVHCDISPDTIMVANSGDIKLTDFGATRYVTTANSKSLALILKQGYAPEEQYRSRGERGPWTDVYALAAVMYRMITGKVPQESVDRALVDELKEPSKLGIAIPQNIENALMNALNVYQNERTPSADVFLKELRSKEVARIKVKKRKNETGKFPAWAKVLVACLSGIVVVGAGLLVYLSGDSVVTPNSTAIALKDLRGMEVSEAEKYIDELNRENGWGITLDTKGYIYDQSNEKNDTIYNQSVEVSTDLSDKESLKNTGLKNENGKVSGTIVCTIYRNDRIHCSEISGMSAFALAKKINLDTTDTARFQKIDADGRNYYDLASIRTKDKVLTAKQIKQMSKDDNNEIIISEIESISYYASDFFYWKSLPAFEGKNLDNLPAYDTYELKNEVTRVKTGKQKALRGTNLIDNGYYTFSSKYKSGDIVKQTVKSGQKLDTSEGMDEALLYVIGQRISYYGETGSQVRAKVNWSGVTVKFSGSGDPSQEVTSVSVQNSAGKSVDYFKKGEALTITIATKQKEEPKPVVTEAPKPKVTPRKPTQHTPQATPYVAQKGSKKNNRDVN